MQYEEYLDLGVWGRREEARKSWSYRCSDVVVYFCDLFSREFQGNSYGRIDWISKFENGHAWLEYHGLLDGERPAYFVSIVEVCPDPPLGFNIDGGIDTSSDGKSMFIDIAKFIQLPKGIIPVGRTSIVRLKFFDNRNGLTGHVPNEFSESLFGLGGPVWQDRKHHLSAGLGISDKGELPCELVKAGAKGVDDIGEGQKNIDVDNVELAADDISLAHKVIAFRDCIFVGPAIGRSQGIKSLQMFVRPAYFDAQIIGGVSLGDHDSENITMPSGVSS